MKTKKALALLLSFVLILSFGAMTAYAASYDFQGTGGQSLKMLNPSDITVNSADTDAYFKNTINTQLDPKADIIFEFLLGAGMNNFTETLFKESNLPLIGVYDSYGGRAVASPAYVSGSSAGIKISVAANTLADGTTYVIVFGKDIRSNNASKIIGKDIVFEFTTKAGVAPETSPFTDVPDWAENYVAAVTANGCMKGLTDTTFGSFDKITRGEFVTVLGQARGIKTANYTTPAFSDIQATDSCSPYVAWAASKNITNGIGDGLFAPYDKLTREQAITMLYRYAVAFSLDTAADGNLSAFSDGIQVSSWASTAMNWAVGHHYVGGTGDSKLVPAVDIGRAEAAKLIAVFMLGE
jgi:hypothetical protein